MSRSRRVALLMATLVALPLAGLLASPALADNGVEVSAVVEGRSFSGEDGPVRLTSTRPVQLQLNVTNNGNEPLELSGVRLSGSALGLTLFSYRTAIGLSVPPHSSIQRTVPVELSGLRGRATGLLSAQLEVLNTRGQSVASDSGRARVIGSLVSYSGALGLLSLVLAAAAFASLRADLRRQGNVPPTSALRRGLPFVPLGLAVALVFAFTLSALGVVPAVGSAGPGVLAAGAIVAFVIGFFRRRLFTEWHSAEDANTPLLSKTMTEDADWWNRPKEAHVEPAVERVVPEPPGEAPPPTWNRPQSGSVVAGLTSLFAEQEQEQVRAEFSPTSSASTPMPDLHLEWSEKRRSHEDEPGSPHEAGPEPSETVR